jgi:hypothetical protein
MVPCDFTECADPVKCSFIVLLDVLNKLLDSLVKAGHGEFADLLAATTSIYMYIPLCSLLSVPRCAVQQTLDLYTERAELLSTGVCVSPV